MPICLNEDHTKDQIINNDWFAFLVAMLLDQQISILWAFNGPNRIVEKINTYRTSQGHDGLTPNSLPPEVILDFTEEEFVDLILTKPTIHRYPKVMAKRIHELAGYCTEHFNGEVEKIWQSENNSSSVYDNFLNLPGFGEEKSKIALAVLCKRFGYKFKDWEKVVSPFGDNQPRTVADAGSPDDYKKIVAWKKHQKLAGRSKED